MEETSLYSELSQVRSDIVAPFISNMNGQNEQEIVDQLLALKELNDKLGEQVVKQVVVKLSVEGRHNDILPTLRKMTLNKNNNFNNILTDSNRENVKYSSEDNTTSEESLNDKYKNKIGSTFNTIDSSNNKQAISKSEVKNEKSKHNNFFKSLLERFNKDVKSSKEETKIVPSENLKTQHQVSCVHPETKTSTKNSMNAKHKVNKSDNILSSNEYFKTDMMNKDNAISREFDNGVNKWQLKESGKDNDLLIPRDGEITAQVRHEEQLLAKEYNFCDQNSSDTYDNNDNNSKEDGQFYVVYNQFLRQHQQ